MTSFDDLIPLLMTLAGFISAVISKQTMVNFAAGYSEPGTIMELNYISRREL